MLVLVPCAVIDIEHRVIPNRITGPAALMAVAIGLALDAGNEPRRLLWAAVAGGFLLVAALVNPAGMGMGDVKLLAVMGLFLGRSVVVALVFALIGECGGRSGPGPAPRGPHGPQDRPSLRPLPRRRVECWPR